MKPMARAAVAVLLAISLFGCSNYDPATIFERYVMSPRPKSVVVVNADEALNSSPVADPAAWLHFKVAPADFDLMVKRLGLKREETFQPHGATGKSWFTPSTLGERQERWQVINGGEYITVWTNPDHDEVYFNLWGL